VQYVRMGMLGMGNTQGVIQSLSQLSWTSHGYLEEIIITVFRWGTWGMGNEIFKPLGYVLQGDPKAKLHGRMREQKIVAKLRWHQYLGWSSTKIRASAMFHNNTYLLHLQMHASIHMTQAYIVRCEAIRQFRKKMRNIWKLQLINS